MLEKHKLMMKESVVARIRAHAAQAYPHECCGALLGRDAGSAREVLDVLPLENRRTDSRANRFSLAPEDFVQAERAAAERGLEVVGWYHSHPDHPPLPSEFDREHAWPWYSYVIVSVARGEPGALMSWRLADDRTRFQFEDVETRTTAAA